MSTYHGDDPRRLDDVEAGPPPHSLSADLKRDKDDALSASEPDAGVTIDEKAVRSSSESIADAAYIDTKGLSVLQVSGLLFGEMVPLAILSVPWTFSQTGFVGGLLIVFIVGVVNLYTSLVLWRYCLRHPDQLNIADIGAHIFSFGRGYSRFGWWLGLSILTINNVFIMGTSALFWPRRPPSFCSHARLAPARLPACTSHSLPLSASTTRADPAVRLPLFSFFPIGFHTLTGSEIINTLSYQPGNGWCTVAISVFVMLVCIAGTLPRKFGHIAKMGAISAISMGICMLLTMIFVGLQHQQPAKKPHGDKVHLTAVAPSGTTFVHGTNAAINIVFLWVGQVIYPSFIAEMKNPRDFPKALYALTVAEFLMFAGVGVFIYAFSGQFSSQPAVAIIRHPTLKKIAFAFALPPTILIGIIYASASARSVFAAFMRDSYHYNHHTKRSWAVWVAIIVLLWVVAWVLGNAIPSFGDIVSLTSALCDSSMGYIFWALAYFELYRGALWRGQSWLRRLETLFNAFLIPCGFFLLGPGVYTSIQQIIDDYNASAHNDPFTCRLNNV